METSEFSALAARVAAGLDDVRACLFVSRDGLTLGAFPPGGEAQARQSWDRLVALGGEPERGFLDRDVGIAQLLERRLRERGSDAALVERVEADRPTIAICVGHQLLFTGSDESPGVRGLGMIDAHVGRYPETVRVPQFGWNALEPEEACDLIEPGYAYFANSYRAIAAPGWRVAGAEHGGRFVAAMERGRVLACQFHPELSGAYGHALLSRWLELAC